MCQSCSHTGPQIQYDVVSPGSSTNPTSRPYHKSLIPITHEHDSQHTILNRYSEILPPEVSHGDPPILQRARNDLYHGGTILDCRVSCDKIWMRLECKLYWNITNHVFPSICSHSTMCGIPLTLRLCEESLCRRREFDLAGGLNFPAACSTH